MHYFFRRLAGTFVLEEKIKALLFWKQLNESVTDIDRLSDVASASVLTPTNETAGY